MRTIKSRSLKLGAPALLALLFCGFSTDAQAQSGTWHIVTTTVNKAVTVRHYGEVVDSELDPEAADGAATDDLSNHNIHSTASTTGEHFNVDATVKIHLACSYDASDTPPNLGWEVYESINGAVTGSFPTVAAYAHSKVDPTPGADLDDNAPPSYSATQSVDGQFNSGTNTTADAYLLVDAQAGDRSANAYAYGSWVFWIGNILTPPGGGM